MILKTPKHRITDEAVNLGDSLNVTTTSQLLVPASDRTELVVTNLSDTAVTLALVASGAVAGRGIVLGPATSTYARYSLKGYIGPVSAIHAGTGTKAVAFAAF